jgi:hypothetical protein
MRFSRLRYEILEQDRLQKINSTPGGLAAAMAHDR